MKECNLDFDREQFWHFEHFGDAGVYRGQIEHTSVGDTYETKWFDDPGAGKDGCYKSLKFAKRSIIQHITKTERLYQNGEVA